MSNLRAEQQEAARDGFLGGYPDVLDGEPGERQACTGLGMRSEGAVMKAVGEPDDGNRRKVATMSGGAGAGFDPGPGHLAPVQRASGLRFRGMGIGHRSQR